MRSPLGETSDLAKLRRDFDAMLDRVEAALHGAKHYDFMDNTADVALTQRFVALVWDSLEHREQNAYAVRIKFMQSGRRPLS